MALDATVGGTSSNSYVTLQEAADYFIDRAYSTNWESFADKEELLILCSRQLDWYVKWKGSKTTLTQSMDWPRSGVQDAAGNEYDDDVIPNEVKTAVFELGLSSLEVDRTSDQDLDGLSEVRAGSLMVKTDTSVRAKKFEAIPEKIRRILSDVTVTSSIWTTRLMRA